MPTPDASQYTQFKRYASISGDAIGSVGSKISPFNTSYTLPILSTSSQALFLPSANKEKKFVSAAWDSNKGAIVLDQPVTKPIIPTGLYDLYTFTPTESGWYHMILNGFGNGNDMDLVVGYGNTETDILPIIDYDLHSESYGTPPETPIKVFSFRSGSDYITSYFSAGCTYQIFIVGYNGSGGGTYTLTIRDNLITVDVPLVSTFYYTDSYQLYRFVAPNNRNYRFQLYFTTSGGPFRNDADIFISEPDTTLDIQGCIDFDNEEVPPPESLMVYGTSGRTEDLRGVTLTSGSVYEVLVYEYYTAPADVFDRYTLTVSLEPLPQITNLQIIFIYAGSNPNIPGGHTRAFLVCNTLNASTLSYVITTSAPPNSIVTGAQYRISSGDVITVPTPQSITIIGNSVGIYLNSNSASIDGPYVMTVTATGPGGSATSSINVPIYR